MSRAGFSDELACIHEAPYICNEAAHPERLWCSLNGILPADICEGGVSDAPLRIGVIDSRPPDAFNHGPFEFVAALLN